MERLARDKQNTLAFWTHLQVSKNKVLRIRSQDPNKLSENAKWNELLALRQSLQKLLPADHPEFELTASKRGATMDFNGIQVKKKLHKIVTYLVLSYRRLI
jgi:hypothetical protein